MSIKDLGLLTALGALWGASFIFIRVAAPALGPFALVEFRVFLAAAALAIYALVIGKALKIRHRWKGFLLLGGLNAAIPFTLISAAQLELTASFGAILNSTTPLFGALVAAVWIGDPLTTRKILGLVLGILGVAVLVGWSPMPVTLALALAVSASLTAALFYGIGSVYAKRNFTGIPPLGLAIGQLSGAAAVTMPVAAMDAPREVPSLVVAASVLALALLSTAVAYLIYFRLIASVGPTKTLTVTFLVPVFGVFLGALLLNEPVGGGTLTGLAIILASVFLVNEVRFREGSRKTGGAE
ncbi:MAG: DMT family transporter [Rubrobacteraceae bacterium]